MRVMRALPFLAAIFLAACSPGGSTPDASTGSASAAVTPLTYSVEDVYRNTRFRGISWSPDGRTLLVSSDLSGIWNAYAVPRDGGAPRALTMSTSNSIFALSYFKADERFLYSSDEAGKATGEHLTVGSLSANPLDVFYDP